MSVIAIQPLPPLPTPNVSAIDAVALERTLRTRTQAEVRFDTVSRALYATDASVYQIMPLGVVVPRSREDFLQVLRVCLELRCPVTMRGGSIGSARWRHAR